MLLGCSVQVATATDENQSIATWGANGSGNGQLATFSTEGSTITVPFGEIISIEGPLNNAQIALNPVLGMNILFSGMIDFDFINDQNVHEKVVLKKKSTGQTIATSSGDGETTIQYIYSGNRFVGSKVYITKHYSNLEPYTSYDFCYDGTVISTVSTAPTTPTPLTASFTTAPTAGTAPVDVQFTDTSTGGASSWSWTFGDGTTSTEKSPVHRYTTAGTYSVSLTIGNAAGLTSTKTQANLISVTAPVSLTANFAASSTSGTAPLAVHFTDQSIGSPNSWSWTFGDGTTSTEQNPSHTYTTAGSYTVSLTARNVAGLTNTKTQTNLISVTTPVIGVPAAEFSATPTLGAGPLTVRFTDTSTGVPTGWYWLFGDGSGSIEQNPSHIYAQAGTYTVQLYAFNAKGYTQKIKANYITVNTAGALTASFTNTPTTGTAPLDVQFTDTSTGGAIAWYWNFGDGTTSTEKSPVHRYTTAGTYAVYLVVANSLGASDYVYSPQPITVTSPVPLTANFVGTPTSGTAPLAVRFTDQSTGGPNSWSWTFGDGTTSTEQNPSHTYTTAGSYTVSLTARNVAGLTNTKTHANLISVTTPVIGVPAAEFSATPTLGVGPLTVRFTDASTGVPTGWYWLFGDGSGSIEQNPSHIYAQAGTYTVQLYAFNAKGYTQKIKTNYITVNTAGALTASFTNTPTSGTAPLNVQFTDTSTGGATFWSWNFGDGAASTDQSPSHTYSQAGTYTTSLTIRNSAGLTSIKEGTITVTAAQQTLQAAFTVNTQTVQSGQSVIGTDASTGSPASWSWNFGDGYAASTRTINHIYTVAGSYTLSLTVTSGSQTSTTSKTITVTNPIVILPGQPYNGPHNAPGTVQAEDYDLGGQNVAYYDTTSGNSGGAYRSDDVDIETGASGHDVGWIIGGEYFTYSVDAATAGDYPIILKAANPDGTAKTVTVSTGSSSTTVSVASTGSFDTYKTFTSAGTLHLAAGRNVVKVTFGASRMNFDYFTIGAGTQPTTITTVTVLPITTITVQPPNGAASFTASTTSGKKSLTIALTDTTTGGNPASWKWNCGNGQTFTGKSVGLNRIWFNYAKTYTITLTVTDQDGSTRTATKTITVTS